MLRLSEMTEELNSKIRDASEEVHACCSHYTCRDVTCCLQAARHRTHHEAESRERESAAQLKIDELSQQLLASKQSSELQLCDAAALRTKLLSAEVQVAEHAQSDPPALPRVPSSTVPSSTNVRRNPELRVSAPRKHAQHTSRAFGSARRATRVVAGDVCFAAVPRTR
jgi:hypothetical protein